jgi:hypothetical protein
MIIKHDESMRRIQFLSSRRSGLGPACGTPPLSNNDAWSPVQSTRPGGLFLRLAFRMRLAFRALAEAETSTQTLAPVPVDGIEHQ